MVWLKTKKKSKKNYRVRSLKTYCSTEWLADLTKNYRSVFQEHELTFVYAELALINLQYECEPWTAHFQLNCYKNQENGRETICKIEVSHTIYPDQQMFYLREGWGHEDAGSFWKRGNYVWEAYINRQLVASTTFYVEDGGSEYEDDENVFFELRSVRFFEEGHERSKNGDYTYLVQFDQHNTRYVWVEVKGVNLQSKNWFCELKFLFFKENRLLKASTTEICEIKPEMDEFFVYTGWGAPEVGTWLPGRYRVCILFMDKLIATSSFEVGERAIAGVYRFQTSEGPENQILEQKTETDSHQESIEELHNQIKSLVGLADVKRKIQEYIHYIEFLKLRRELKFDEDPSPNLHTVFKGSPGTGKTTVARILAKIYHRMGLLSSGHLVEVGRNELIGQYIGQTAPKVVEIIQKARGGVLFVDEAYALARAGGDEKDYGMEAIEVLVKEMSDGAGDLAIFVAGYPHEMDVFLNSNPGLKSRFKMVFEFEDFMPDQLFELLQVAAARHQVEFTPEALSAMQRHLTELYRSRDKSFGNARTVNSIVEDAKMVLGVRVMTEVAPEDRRHKDTLRLVTLADVEKVFEKRKTRTAQIGIDRKALDEAMNALNKLVGLASIKREIRELVELVRFYQETGQEVTGKFSLHTVFKGNPGTGKTTVARIMANIFKALGLLERGHLVECDRQSLVAGFVGQTALKTQEMLEKAKGGVLFIDEAYSLMGEGKGEDFGKEAIEVILKAMEDKRGEFMVIVAGYTEEMKRFMRMNPGLKSRFDREIYFEDFTIDEMLEIALSMIADAGLKPDPEAVAALRQMLQSLHQSRDRYFGNARAARRIVDMAIRNQHLRMATILGRTRSPEELHQLTAEDIQRIDFSQSEELQGHKVGFRTTN